MTITAIDDKLAGFATSTSAYGVRASVQIGTTPAFFASHGLDARSPASTMEPPGRFRIGSVTKTFTAAMVLGLVGDGHLGLDDRLATWLPEYPRAADISVRQLLVHTAGTADPILDDFDAYLTLLLTDPARCFSTDEVVSLAAGLPPVAEPGDAYRYSNTDFHLLGAIVEQISSKGIGSCLQSVADSSGLLRTAIIMDRPPDLAHGWFGLGSSEDPHDAPQRDIDVLDIDNTALLSLAHAAGGATSDLADLVQWGRALYLGDVLDARERAVLLRSPTHPDAEMAATAGLGVYGFGESDGTGCWDAYGHTGNIVGSTTALFAWPRHDAVVAVHANIQEISGGHLFALATDLLRVCLDDG